MTYHIDQVRDYVEGWLGSSSDMRALTINEIKAMLNNALVTLECGDDGLKAYVNRQISNKRMELIMTTFEGRPDYENIKKDIMECVLSDMSYQEIVEKFLNKN